MIAMGCWVRILNSQELWSIMVALWWSWLSCKCWQLESAGRWFPSAINHHHEPSFTSWWLAWWSADCGRDISRQLIIQLSFWSNFVFHHYPFLFLSFGYLRSPFLSHSYPLDMLGECYPFRSWAQVAELEVQMAEAESQKIDEASSCEEPLVVALRAQVLGVKCLAKNGKSSVLNFVLVLGASQFSFKQGVGCWHDH